MHECKQCHCPIEPFEVKCHNCGAILSTDTAPTVPEDTVLEPDLEEAFNSWLSQGARALTQKDYSQACVCFSEAVLRAQGLTNGGDKQLLARRKLASTLEKLDKLIEAVEQYQILAGMSHDSKLKSSLDGKVTSLMRRVDETKLSDVDNSFRAIAGDEYKYVSLYCASCKRLLTEAEVYGFRNESEKAPMYLCGHEGQPVVKHDRAYHQAVRYAARQTIRADVLTEIAKTKLTHGLSKTKAAALTVLFGYLGAHKFYLQERAAGFVYLAWFSVFSLLAIYLSTQNDNQMSPVTGFVIACVILVALSPWLISFSEAIRLLQMDNLTFNLTYNIEQILNAMPPLAPPSEINMDVFSMEISDEED